MVVEEDGRGRMGKGLTEMNVKVWRTRESGRQSEGRDDLQRTDHSLRETLSLHYDHW